MKIYDCCMFFDEEMLLGLRLKTLNKYIDKFIIVESKYTHSGDKKKLIFNINKYSEFKNKINYIVTDDPPEGIESINNDDNEKYLGSHNRSFISFCARFNYLYLSTHD